MFWIPSNFTLKGNFYSQASSEFIVRYMYVPNNSWKTTFEEYQSNVIHITLDLITTNEYFDLSNQEDPVQSVLSNQFYAYFSIDELTIYDVFIQRNTYEVESGNLFTSKKTGEFYRANTEK